MPGSDQPAAATPTPGASAGGTAAKAARPFELKSALRDAFQKKAIDKIVSLGFLPLSWLLQRVTGEPFHALVVLVPLALLVAELLRRSLRRPALALEGPFRWFVPAYIGLFALAAGSSLLEWRRTPMVGGVAPRNWLAPVWMGDWRYWLVSRPSPAGDLLVITMKRAPTVLAGRADVMRLLDMARLQQARAVVLDFQFRDSTALDELLCRAVESAVAAQPPVDVVAGYGFDRQDGDIVRQLYPRRLGQCLPLASAQGHVVVYRDTDHLVRSLPMTFRWQDSLPALSVRAADRMARRAGRPIGPLKPGLLQFVAPDPAVKVMRFEDLTPDTEALLRDRMLLVGEDSEAETFRTPDGVFLGVQLHAHAVQALLQGAEIRRIAWWPSLLGLTVACYLLAASTIAGASRPRLLMTTLVLSAAWVGVASAAIGFGRVWIDVVYVLVGSWLFLACLLVLRRTSRSRT